MANYELETVGGKHILNYTGDGWVQSELTPQQKELWDKGELDVFSLEWK